MEVIYCKRCGRPRYKRAPETQKFLCVHTASVGVTRNADHALRIRAAYELGRELNQDHDETDYFEQTKISRGRRRRR